MTNCLDLQLLLSENKDVNKSDIDAIENITDKLSVISELLKPNNTSLDVLLFCYKYK